MVCTVPKLPPLTHKSRLPQVWSALYKVATIVTQVITIVIQVNITSGMVCAVPKLPPLSHKSSPLSYKSRLPQVWSALYQSCHPCHTGHHHCHTSQDYLRYGLRCTKFATIVTQVITIAIQVKITSGMFCAVPKLPPLSHRSSPLPYKSRLPRVWSALYQSCHHRHISHHHCHTSQDYLRYGLRSTKVATVTQVIMIVTQV